MITEVRGLPDFWKAAPLALGLWFAGLAAITPLLEPTRDVLVFSPAATIERLPTAGATLVDAASFWTRVRRSEPGFVNRLYANGAWLVFPAFEGGCNRVAPGKIVSAATN
jgi:hypothetical protein